MTMRQDDSPIPPPPLTAKEADKSLSILKISIYWRAQPPTYGKSNDINHACVQAKITNFIANCCVCVYIIMYCSV